MTRMTRTSRRLLAATAATSAMLLALTAAPASAHTKSPQHLPRVLNTEVLAPFQLAVNHNRLYAADGFTGNVSRLDGNHLTTLLNAPGAAGLDFSRNGKQMAYTWSTTSPEQQEPLDSGMVITQRGKADVHADIHGYEWAHNPDHVNTYGIVAGGNACAEAILGQLTGMPATYQGERDAHAYSVARFGNSWLVADAGANVIFEVSSSGAISTYAVLPPQPVTITPEMVSGLEASSGAPAGSLGCLVGVTYAFEPVPTDVEVGPHGTVWVSTLPGGPEDPSLGARGSVYRIDSHGHSTRVATGFLGATNLAVASNGTVYVAELFAGKISTIKGKKVNTFAHVDSPLGLEVHGGSLYVGTMAAFDEMGNISAPGSIVKMKR